MIKIPSALIKQIPYVGPVVSAVGLASDVQAIVDTTTPIGAAKIISGRILKECTPPELFFAGKCIMLTGGVIASFTTAGNPLALSGTISAFRSIIQD